MANKPFTEEEIQILRKNPNTAHVTLNRISLTPETKKTIPALHEAGRSSRRIIAKPGCDTGIPGDCRVRNPVRCVQNEANSGIGLHEG